MVQTNISEMTAIMMMIVMMMKRTMIRAIPIAMTLWSVRFVSKQRSS